MQGTRFLPASNLISATLARRPQPSERSRRYRAACLHRLCPRITYKTVAFPLGRHKERTNPLGAKMILIRNDVEELTPPRCDCTRIVRDYAFSKASAGLARR